jgi:hypothetical protein
MTTGIPIINSLKTTATHDFRDEDRHSELDLQLDNISDGGKLNVAKIVKSDIQPSNWGGILEEARRKITQIGLVGSASQGAKCPWIRKREELPH